MGFEVPTTPGFCSIAGVTMSKLGICTRRSVWFLLALFIWIVAAGEITARSAVAQDAGAGGQVQPAQQKSTVVWFFQSIGVIGIGIILLSMYFIATVSKLFFELRPEVAMPPELVAKCEEMLGKKDFMGIYNQLKTDKTYFGRVLYTGISELPNGMSEAREAMAGVGEAITVGMEKKISILAVLGTLGPMIGLLGTLLGMIESFSVIALSDVQLKASEVAGGISRALLLTLLGVGLSVPAIYFFSVFKNRVAAISVDTVLKADEFLRHFGFATRKKPATAAAAAPEASAS